MEPPVSAETPQASPPDHASPTRLFPWPGESCCTGMPQMPLTCSPAPEAFPWRRARHGSPLPRLCPLPHQPRPTQHCPYSPLQISASFSGLWSLRGRAASPRHRASSDFPLPSTLPAAQRPALPARLHALLPLIRAEPREDQYPRGVALSKAAAKPTCVGRGGRGRPRPCTGLLLADSAVAGTGARLPKEGPRGLWLTDEPHGRLSHGGLSILQVWQALMTVFFSPAPVLHHLERAQGDGHVTAPPQVAGPGPPRSTPRTPSPPRPFPSPSQEPCGAEVQREPQAEGSQGC